MKSLLKRIVKPHLSKQRLVELQHRLDFVEGSPSDPDAYRLFLRYAKKSGVAVPEGLYESIINIMNLCTATDAVVYSELVSICSELLPSAEDRRHAKAMGETVGVNETLEEIDNCFLVTSGGRTATYWLASKLNLHPDIICSHGRYIPPVVEYHDMIPAGQDLRAWAVPNNLKPAEYFAEIRKVNVAKFYGNVHGWMVSDLLHAGHDCDDSIHYPVVNLVRHPIARTHSFWRRWTMECSYNVIMRDQIVHAFWRGDLQRKMAAEVKGCFGVDCSEMKDLLFIHAVAQMVLDAKEATLEFKQIRMEDITKKVDSFVDLFRILTCDEIQPSQNYIKEVFSTSSINRSEKVPMSTQERYDGWSEWQRHIFSSCARNHNFKGVYGRLGYTCMGF